MTTSLVFSTPGLCMAAADTRISMSDASFGSHVADGPGDYVVNVSSRNYQTVIPYRMRKIANIGNSWGAIAGDCCTGAAALALLKDNGLDNSSKAVEQLRSKNNEILYESRQLGFLDSNSLQTRVMVALANGGIWHCMLTDLRVAEEVSPDSCAMNIPSSIDARERDRLENAWLNEVTSSSHSRDMGRLFKASASLIYGAHLQSICTGPRIQIGFTLNTPGGYRKGYLDAESSVILESSDDELVRMTSWIP